MSCVTADPICAARGTTPILLARIEANDSGDSSPIVQADVSTIVYTVRDLDDVDEITGLPRESAGGTLTASSVIFDTLQTGTIWDVDDTGYNFKHQLPTTAIDSNEDRFLAEYTVTLADGAVCAFSYEINAQIRYGHP